MASSMSIDRPAAIILPEDELHEKLRQDGEQYKIRLNARTEREAAGLEIVSEQRYRDTMWLRGEEELADLFRNKRLAGEELTEENLKIIEVSDRRRAAAVAPSSGFSNIPPPNASTTTATGMLTTFNNPFISSTKAPASATTTNSSSPNTSRNVTTNTSSSTPGSGLSLKAMASRAKDARRRMNALKKLDMEDNIKEEDRLIVKEYEQMKNAAEILSASAAPTGSVSNLAPTGNKDYETDRMDTDTSSTAIVPSMNSAAPLSTTKSASQTFQPLSIASAARTAPQETNKPFSFSLDSSRGTLNSQQTQISAVSFGTPNINTSSIAEPIKSEKNDSERARQEAFLQQIAQSNTSLGMPGPFDKRQTVKNATISPNSVLFESSTTSPTKKTGKFSVHNFGPNANPFGQKKVPTPLMPVESPTSVQVNGPSLAAPISAIQGANSFSFGAGIKIKMALGPSVATPIATPQDNNPFTFTTTAPPADIDRAAVAVVARSQENNPFAIQPTVPAKQDGLRSAGTVSATLPPPQSSGLYSAAPVSSSQSLNISSIPPSEQAVGNLQAVSSTSSSVDNSQNTTRAMSCASPAPALNITPTVFTSFPRPISPGKKNRQSRFGRSGLHGSATNIAQSLFNQSMGSSASQGPQLTPLFGSGVGSNPPTMAGSLPNLFQGGAPTAIVPSASSSTPLPASSSFSKPLRFGPVTLAPCTAPAPAQRLSLINDSPGIAPPTDTDMGEAPEPVGAVESAATPMEGVEEVASPVPEAVAIMPASESRADSEMMDVATPVAQSANQVDRNVVTGTDTVMDDAPVPTVVPLPVIAPPPKQISLPVDPLPVEPDAVVTPKQDEPQQIQEKFDETEQDITPSAEDEIASVPESAEDASSIENDGHLDQSKVAGEDAVLVVPESPPVSSGEPSGKDSESIVEPASPDAGMTKEDVSKDSSKGEEVLPVETFEPSEVSRVVEDSAIPVLEPATDLLSEINWRNSPPLLLGQINILRQSERGLEEKVGCLQQSIDRKDSAIKTLKSDRRVDRRKLKKAETKVGKLASRLVAVEGIRKFWRKECESKSRDLELERSTRSSMVAAAIEAYAKSKEASDRASLDENAALKKQIRELRVENSKLHSAKGQEEQIAEAQSKKIWYLGEYQYQALTVKKSLSAQRGFARADYMFAMEANDVAAASIALGQLQIVDDIAARVHEVRQYEEVGGKILSVPKTHYIPSPADSYALEESDTRMMDGRDDSATWAHLDSKTVLYTRNNRSIARFLAFDSPCKTRPCRDPLCNHGAPPTMKSAVSPKLTPPTQGRTTPTVPVLPSSTVPPLTSPIPPANLAPTTATTAPIVSVVAPTNSPPVAYPLLPTTLSLVPATASLAPGLLNPVTVIPTAATAGATSSTTAALPTIVQAQSKAWYKRSPPRWISIFLALLAFLIVAAGVAMTMQNYLSTSTTPHTSQNSLISLNDTCAFVPPTLTAVSCGTESPTAVINTQTAIETDVPTSTDSVVPPEASGGDHSDYEEDDFWEKPVHLDTWSWQTPVDVVVLVTTVAVPVTIMAWACGGR